MILPTCEMPVADDGVQLVVSKQVSRDLGRAVRVGAGLKSEIAAADCPLGSVSSARPSRLNRERDRPNLNFSQTPICEADPNGATPLAPPGGREDGPDQQDSLASRIRRHDDWKTDL